MTAHWQIENGLHWVLDIALREDESRLRKDLAPQDMAVLRHMATNLLKQDTSVKMGIAAKRKRRVGMTTICFAPYVQIRKHMPLP